MRSISEIAIHYLVTQTRLSSVDLREHIASVGADPIWTTIIKSQQNDYQQYLDPFKNCVVLSCDYPIIPFLASALCSIDRNTVYRCVVR